MAASSLDEDHTLVVYDVQKAIEARERPGGKSANPGQVCKGKGARAEILHLKFALDNVTLIAACNKEMQFFTVDPKL